MSRRALAAALGWALLFAPAGVHADLEPPPESPEGADYALDLADSLENGAVELGVGVSGASGESARRSRRVRFADGEFTGDVRDGDGDPLAGGAIGGRLVGGRIGFGRLAPRWGRGLVLGAAAEPWAMAAADRGAGAPFRGRSGEGGWWRAGDGTSSLELLGGRFARRDLAGVALAHGPLRLGVLGDRGRSRQVSVGWGAGAGELALARDGAWRLESRLARRVGPLDLSLLARGGRASFRPLAEPRRAGPSRALALHGGWRHAATRVGGLAAAWRFAPHVTGARAALEVERTLAQHDALRAGIEEHHGTRREPPAKSPGFRHGAWAEWHGTRGMFAMALRHEWFGSERLARTSVRSATALRLDLLGPAGARLRLTHWAWSTRRGETLYLPEAASDRLVLRALSGVGERTRLELRLPWSGGRVNASLSLDGGAVARAPRWTLDWTRRARGTRPP